MGALSTPPLSAAAATPLRPATPAPKPKPGHRTGTEPGPSPSPKPEQDVACEYPTPDGPGTDLGLITADRDRHAAAIWSAFAASYAARHQGEGVEDDE